jgi:hypothetical protein
LTLKTTSRPVVVERMARGQIRTVLRDHSQIVAVVRESQPFGVLAYIDRVDDARRLSFQEK